MKTKKALAVLLAVVMLVMPLAVSSFAANEVLSGPDKTNYYDTENFNPQGIVISVNGEKIPYSPTDSNFRFDPALNELLVVTENDFGQIISSTVAIYYDNAYIGEVEVTVNHKLGNLTPIDNGHGYYCLGCGKLHDFKKHNVENWIPNDDGGIFIQQTQTGKCTECGAEVTEKIPDSQQFSHIFNYDNMTDLESEILSYVESILVSLIQMLTSIS